MLSSSSSPSSSSPSSSQPPPHHYHNHHLRRHDLFMLSYNSRRSGGRLSVKMSSYQYREPHVKDKMAPRPSYLYNANHIPGKTVFILRRGAGDTYIRQWTGTLSALVIKCSSLVRGKSNTWTNITMTSQWARWRLKSPDSRLFAQPFIQGADQRNIKAPRHWPLCGELTGHRWIPRTKGQ